MSFILVGSQGFDGERLTVNQVMRTSLELVQQQTKQTLAKPMS